MRKILETVQYFYKIKIDPKANLNPDLNPNPLTLTQILTQFPFRICAMRMHKNVKKYQYYCKIKPNHDPNTNPSHDSNPNP